MPVFFYGLFMDESLLAARGIEPSDVNVGFVDGYRLLIGERATLVRRDDDRAYGAVMDIAPGEVAELYADDSVAGRNARSGRRPRFLAHARKPPI